MLHVNVMYFSVFMKGQTGGGSEHWFGEWTVKSHTLKKILAAFLCEEVLKSVWRSGKFPNQIPLLYMDTTHEQARLQIRDAAENEQ